MRRQVAPGVALANQTVPALHPALVIRGQGSCPAKPHPRHRPVSTHRLGPHSAGSKPVRIGAEHAADKPREGQAPGLAPGSALRRFGVAPRPDPGKITPANVATGHLR